MSNMEYVEKFIKAYNAGKIPFQLAYGAIPFKNYEKIHPLKQKEIYSIITQVKNCRIYLFGSSITPYCHSGSDIDLAIECDTEETWSLNARVISRATAGNCDILWFNELQDGKFKDNVKKGLVIYDDIT